MEKADNPFPEPRPAQRFMSHEGWVSLAAVLSVHLLFAGWIGCGDGGDRPVMTAPVTGVLIAGDGSGGNRGGSGRLAGKKTGSGKTLHENVPEASGKTETGMSEKAMKKKAAGTRDGKTDRMPAAGLAMQDGKTSSAVSPGKKDETKGFADASSGTSGRNGGENPSGGVSGDGRGNGSDGNGGGYGHGGSGNGYGAANGSGGFSGPYGKAGSAGNPKPPYPAVSRRMGEEGVVILSVYILADGRVADVKVKRSSGFPRLDKSALKTVRHWRYVPAKKDGRPVAFRYAQPVRFSLND